MKKIKILSLILLITTLMLTLISCSSVPYNYELSEHIVIGDYTQISVDEEKISELAEKYKSDLLEAHSQKSKEQITGRALRIGDIAVVSYKCYLEEDTLSPIAEAPVISPVLEDSSCEIILGREKYPAEFEAMLVGLTPSSKEHTWHISIPSEFGLSKLSGKNAVFTVTVNAAFELITPNYDDEFVSQTTRYSTVAEYEKAMLEQARLQLVWDELVARSEIVSYPKNELNDHTLDFIEYYTNQATAQSLTLEQYVARKFFIELSAFHIKADEYSKQLTKNEIMIYSIARTNELELTDEEYEQHALEYAQDYGYSTLSEYELAYGKPLIKYSILREKVMRYVADHSLSATVPPTNENVH